MPVHENREHFRVEDQLCFEYKPIQSGTVCSDDEINDSLLRKKNSRYLEAMQYLQSMDNELIDIKRKVALKEPVLAHYLNLLNEKIDYLSRQLLIDEKIQLRKASLSLGGMSFKTKEKLDIDTYMKIVIYTKPRMIPILLDAVVINCTANHTHNHHTAVRFENLSTEQEELLAQHIILCQTRSRAN